MARSLTLGAITTLAKQRADVENQSNIDTVEWRAYFSTAYAELYSILVESGMRYFESEDTITTDGNSTYALPANFLVSIGVDYENTASDRRQLQEAMVQERNIFKSSSGAGESVAYAIIGSNVKLYPTPASGQTYYHVYVPQPTIYTSSDADGTSIDVVTPDGENFIVWSMAVYALAKEESDLNFAVGERERARERLAQWAAFRSFNSQRRNIVQSSVYDHRMDPGDWWDR